jgi:hypothetical protein
MTVVRTAVGLIGLILTGCASAHYVPIKASDAIGPCATEVPQRDLLIGVALSGGGTRAALFGVGRLEAWPASAPPMAPR